MFQEVFEDLVSWRGPAVSAHARDTWTLACWFESENWTPGNCCRLFWSDVDCENSASWGWAGFCWHLAALLFDSFWSWKCRVFSANLRCANLFFSYLALCHLCFQLFLCRCGLTYLFDLLFFFNKITDFHFGFSFHFVFENFFLEFECAACLLLRLLIVLL